jgi:hypothetical protein
VWRIPGSPRLPGWRRADGSRHHIRVGAGASAASEMFTIRLSRRGSPPSRAARLWPGLTRPGNLPIVARAWPATTAAARRRLRPDRKPESPTGESYMAQLCRHGEMEDGLIRRVINQLSARGGDAPRAACLSRDIRLEKNISHEAARRSGQDRSRARIGRIGGGPIGGGAVGDGPVGGEPIPVGPGAVGPSTIGSIGISPVGV